MKWYVPEKMADVAALVTSQNVVIREDKIGTAVCTETVFMADKYYCTILTVPILIWCHPFAASIH
jgi:hypothetical protein